MKYLKVGDRVKVYGHTMTAYFRGQKGTIELVHDNGDLKISLDNMHSVVVHPKQCRRLVPKKKHEVFIVQDGHGNLYLREDEKEATRTASIWEAQISEDGPHRVYRYVRKEEVKC